MRSPQLIVIWLIIIIFSATAFGGVVYLSRLRNSSVEFSCTDEIQNAFAFSLVRDLVKPEKVLYVHFGTSPSIYNEKDKNRIVVQRDVKNQKVNVSIMHLLGRHTDLYRCVFHYDYGNKFEDYFGKTEYFLYVQDSIPEECICYSYEPLLYALSAAAALLFLCVLFLAGVYCKRPPSQQKPQAVPIYEEMNGVRTANGKAGSCQPSVYTNDQVDTEMSLYIRPRKENPYDPAPGSDLYSL